MTDRTWRVQIPCPPSLNKIIRLHWAHKDRAKKRYVNEARLALLAGGFGLVKRPLEHKIRVAVELHLYYPSNQEPDPDNWFKWIGDTLAGFLVPDDTDEWIEWSWRKPVKEKRGDKRWVTLVIREMGKEDR